MNSSIIFVILSLLLFSAAMPAGSDEYLSGLREAVSKIRSGAYDQAASCVERALMLDGSDPLGRTVLAVIYLHTGKLDEAEREFNQVLASHPEHWQSHYALGLISAADRKMKDAERHFASARRVFAAADEMSALDRYFSFFDEAGPKVSGDVSEALPMSLQVAAMALLKLGDEDAAASLLSRLLSAPAALGFEERRAPLVTFDPKHPIEFPKGKLRWKPTERKDAPVVSGIVTLKADMSRTSGVVFVSFYVDQIFAGVTNYEPFQFDWNTTKHPNGLHEIRMEGKDLSGDVVARKSVWVRVHNENARQGLPRTGPEAADLAKQLWDCLRLSGSRKLAHYHLAKIYLNSGDSENAIKHLEYAVAYQSDFKDARELLSRLRRSPRKYMQINRGPGGSKMIALTFDDGPNERTAHLLDVLARLDVPATFFVVGFRAETQPRLMQAIQSAGHEIQNHTYSHTKLTSLSAEKVEAELSKTAAVIRAITGKPSFYFRPPGGHVNEATKQAAAKQGFAAVFWTINCSPFEGSRYEALAHHVISNACNGAIVLMHNGEPAATSALPGIVEALRKQGYRFVTLSEMLAAASNGSGQASR